MKTLRSSAYSHLPTNYNFTSSPNHGIWHHHDTAGAHRKQEPTPRYSARSSGASARSRSSPNSHRSGHSAAGQLKEQLSHRSSENPSYFGSNFPRRNVNSINTNSNLARFQTPSELQRHFQTLGYRSNRDANDKPISKESNATDNTDESHVFATGLADAVGKTPGVPHVGSGEVSGSNSSRTEYSNTHPSGRGTNPHLGYHTNATLGLPRLDETQELSRQRSVERSEFMRGKKLNKSGDTKSLGKFTFLEKIKDKCCSGDCGCAVSSFTCCSVDESDKTKFANGYNNGRKEITLGGSLKSKQKKESNMNSELGKMKASQKSTGSSGPMFSFANIFGSANEPSTAAPSQRSQTGTSWYAPSNASHYGDKNNNNNAPSIANSLLEKYAPSTRSNTFTNFLQKTSESLGNLVGINKEDEEDDPALKYYEVTFPPHTKLGFAYVGTELVRVTERGYASMHDVQVDDEIINVNGIIFADLEKKQRKKLLKESTDPLKILFKRPKYVDTYFQVEAKDWEGSVNNFGIEYVVETQSSLREKKVPQIKGPRAPTRGGGTSSATGTSVDDTASSVATSLTSFLSSKSSGDWSVSSEDLGRDNFPDIRDYKQEKYGAQIDIGVGNELATPKKTKKKVKRTAVIAAVAPNSWASKVGLQPGDILNELNGREFNRIKENDLMLMLLARPVTFSIKRPAKKHTKHRTLNWYYNQLAAKQKKSSKSPKGQDENTIWSVYGDKVTFKSYKLDEATRDDALDPAKEFYTLKPGEAKRNEKFGFQFSPHTGEITKVKESGFAHRMGVEIDDQIYAVNGQQFSLLTKNERKQCLAFDSDDEDEEAKVLLIKRPENTDEYFELNLEENIHNNPYVTRNTRLWDGGNLCLGVFHIDETIVFIEPNTWGSRVGLERGDQFLELNGQDFISQFRKEELNQVFQEFLDDPALPVSFLIKRPSPINIDCEALLENRCAWHKLGQKPFDGDDDDDNPMDALDIFSSIDPPLSYWEVSVPRTVKKLGFHFVGTELVLIKEDSFAKQIKLEMDDEILAVDNVPFRNLSKKQRKQVLVTDRCKDQSLAPTRIIFKRPKYKDAYFVVESFQNKALGGIKFHEGNKVSFLAEESFWNMSDVRVGDQLLEINGMDFLGLIDNRELGEVLTKDDLRFHFKRKNEEKLALDLLEQSKNGKGGFLSTINEKTEKSFKEAENAPKTERHKLIDRIIEDYKAEDTEIKSSREVSFDDYFGKGVLSRSGLKQPGDDESMSDEMTMTSGDGYTYYDVLVPREKTNFRLGLRFNAATSEVIKLVDKGFAQCNGVELDDEIFKVGGILFQPLSSVEMKALLTSDSYETITFRRPGRRDEYYTRIFEMPEFIDLNNKKSFPVLGLQLVNYTVCSTAPGSWANNPENDIRVGDKLIEVNGEQVSASMSLDAMARHCAQLEFLFQRPLPEHVDRRALANVCTFEFGNFENALRTYERETSKKKGGRDRSVHFGTDY